MCQILDSIPGGIDSHLSMKKRILFGKYVDVHLSNANKRYLLVSIRKYVQKLIPRLAK